MKTPTVLQMEAVECGAAALGIVLAHYGRILPLPILRRDCGVSRDGSKASNVVKAARRHKMIAKGFKKTLKSAQNVRFPAIVFWNFNHFVVLEGFRRGRAYLNDPASGRRTVTLEEFDEGFTGVVLVMEPGPEFEKGGRPPSVVGSLKRNLSGSYMALFYCILAGFLLVLPGLALPVLTQLFIDHVLIQGRYEWLRPILFGIAATILVQGLLDYLRLRHLRDLRIKLSIAMSSRFLWHVLKLPVNYFAQRYSGEITSRIRLNDGVARILSGRLATTTIDAVMLFFYGALMWWYDPVLTMVGIAAASLNVVALKLISSKRSTANMRLLQEKGKLRGVAVAGLQSIETLKASAQESSFFARWSGYHAKTINAKQEMAFANQLLGVVPSLLTSFTALLVLCLGGLRVIEGAMTIGMLVAFQVLLRKFQSPINTLVGMGEQLQTLGGDLARLDDVLQHPTDPQAENPLSAETNGAGPASNRLEGYVELKDVTFSYNPIEPPLIQNLSLSLKPGQRVALVGGSGSGKSTIAKLIAGLDQVDSGEVLFDGKTLAKTPRRVLANSLAMVEQEIFFFGGSVWENLTLWDETVTDRDLQQACADAHILDVVKSMPGGFNAQLLEGGVNLSGGQRQRLEIARALVHNPSILILDEATAALDAETERIIDHNLRLRGCTCVVVAHRLSTIRDCDEIIVLSHGKVVQRGTFEYLLRTGGEFADLLRRSGQVGEEAAGG